MRKTIIYLLAALFLCTPCRVQAQSSDDDSGLGAAALMLLFALGMGQNDKDDLLFEGENFVGYNKTITADNDSIYGDGSDLDLGFCCYCDLQENISSVMLILNDEDFDDPLQNTLLKKLHNCSTKEREGIWSHYGIAVFSLDDAEQFTVPYYYEYDTLNEDGPMGTLYTYLNNAISSNRIEEVGSDRWNEWSTLKYLNSRLAKKDIDFIVLQESDGSYIGYIEPNTTTKEKFQTIFKRLGDNLDNHEFYKYSWE